MMELLEDYVRIEDFEDELEFVQMDLKDSILDQAKQMCTTLATQISNQVAT